MTPADRVLRLLTAEYGGERKFNVIRAVVGDKSVTLKTLAALRKDGLVRFRACYEGGRWALTKKGQASGAAVLEREARR